MTALPSLRTLQAFEAAARTGSFVAAAEELAISPAAMSQLVATLEDHVGRKLFHRINRRAVLTEAGREVLPRLTLAFEELNGAARDLIGSAHRARLVVSVPPSVAVSWLPSRLPLFIGLHGEADIFLKGEEEPIAFERDLIDIRLSYGRFPDRDHDAEPIASDAVHPVCTPGVLSHNGPVRDARDLLSMPLIHTDWGPAAASFPTWRLWFEAASVTAGREIHRGLTVNSSAAALDLALSGLGVALCQGLFAARAVEEGRLVKPVKQALPLAQPYCLTVPQRSARRAIVAVFKDWFVAECLKSIQSRALV
ncbi:LysR substrate-binding domain-containing protein [Taklimakanibacter deserti]|uniref:LysR substrate-binding domain-containing protein n=1 Tax=Taklimakanibacter deserti TaxID=2267839 RepID=UPI000E64E669